MNSVVGLIIIILLSDKREVDSLHGRIVQDVVVVPLMSKRYDILVPIMC